MMCFLSFSFQCYITCKAYLQQAPDSPQSGQQSSHKCESQPGHSRTLAHDQSAAQQAQASLWHQPSNQGESLWYLWGICDSAGLPEGKTPTKVFIMSFQWSLDAMKLVEQSPLNIFTFAWTFSCNWGFFLLKFLTNKADILRWYVEGHLIIMCQLQYLHLDTAVFPHSYMSVFMTSCHKIRIYQVLDWFIDFRTHAHNL